MGNCQHILSKKKRRKQDPKARVNRFIAGDYSPGAIGTWSGRDDSMWLKLAE